MKLVGQWQPRPGMIAEPGTLRDAAIRAIARRAVELYRQRRASGIRGTDERQPAKA